MKINTLYQKIIRRKSHPRAYYVYGSTNLIEEFTSRIALRYSRAPLNQKLLIASADHSTNRNAVFDSVRNMLRKKAIVIITSTNPPHLTLNLNSLKLGDTHVYSSLFVSCPLSCN